MVRRAELVILELILFVLAALTLVHSQSQTGFISIDCGGSTSYADDTTGIIYVPDTGYISSGESKSVAAQYKANIITHFETVRSFPQGVRNCYTLPLLSGDVKYLIRARFYYGNYDLKNKLPVFDLYIGVNLWTTVSISIPDGVATAEMIHVPSSNVTNVCLVNKGSGTPFISVLELRPIDKNLYPLKTAGALTLYNRYNLGSNSTYRYRYDYDVYDRIWNTIDWSDADINLSTNQDVESGVYDQPSVVMRTAVTPRNPLKPLQFYLSLDGPGTEYFFYLHYAEIQTLAADEFRGFDIYLNDSFLYGPVIPEFLSAGTLYTTKPLSAQTILNFTLIMTDNSTLPPILNALEIFTLTYLPQLETDPKDAQAMNNIKSTYNVSKIWQGDPCSPQNYSWDGLNCSFSDNQAPQVISLDLSSSGLNGKISDDISDLTMLQKLDLSNNSLTGTVPDFLSTMASLSFLNLGANNLSGTVPASLVKKAKAGSLTLKIEGNPNLCLSSPCSGVTNDSNGTKKKSTSLLILLAAAVAGALILVVILLGVFCIVKRNKTRDRSRTSVVVVPSIPKIPAPVVTEGREAIEMRNQRFTYSEVVSMTNNFTRQIGKGGFGTVYHGHLDDVQVAVKMLSPSSSQGYKEFKAEAQLLMKVHHRNLTSLVGYCDEGDKLALIYEFMAQGDLHSHISDKNIQYLTWEDRLHITLDAAQGLEYLHHGCKPSIVHRDIKSTNILLNDKYEAKLADFGLSRACLPDGQTGIQPTTMVAGTIGYLDPEYYRNQQLNEKSDVFSFGIVILEVITSRPVISPNGTNLSRWVDEVLSTQGDVKVILDPRLRGDYDKNSVWKAVELAMHCVSTTSNQRPSMSEVVSELAQCLSLEQARKNEGFTTDTIDSAYMLSLGMDTSFTPSAR